MSRSDSQAFADREYREVMRGAIEGAFEVIEVSGVYAHVEAALYSVARARERATARRERDIAEVEARTLAVDLKRMADAGEVTPESYPGLEQRAKMAVHLSAAVHRSGILDALVDAKASMGERLLEERHTAARERLREVVSDEELERHRRATVDPATLSREVQAMIKKVGAANLSSQFFDHMVSIGEWPDPGEYHRIIRSAKGRKEVNAAYGEYLNQRAKKRMGIETPSDEDVAKIGQRVIDHAREVSGLTLRDAAAIVKDRVRSREGARKAASRSGLGAKGFDRALVELAQLAGRAMPAGTRTYVGSLGEVRHLANAPRMGSSSGRAFQFDKPSTGEVGRSNLSFICMTGRSGKRTLFHEFGHAIEAANPMVNSMVTAWVRRRTEGEDAKSLKSLTGVKGYNIRERAIKDDFIDPYVGKVYRQQNGVQATEALSMGLERLADPAAAGQLAVHDPDHLALILAALQTEYQP